MWHEQQRRVNKRVAMVRNGSKNRPAMDAMSDFNGVGTDARCKLVTLLFRCCFIAIGRFLEDGTSLPSCHDTRDRFGTPNCPMLEGVSYTPRLLCTNQLISESSWSKLPQAQKWLPSHHVIYKWHRGHLSTLASSSSQPIQQESNQVGIPY